MKNLLLERSCFCEVLNC